MPEPDEFSTQNNRRYKWPWFALAFVLLGIVMAVLWVALAAKKIEQRRDFNEPLPSTAPAR
jgi:F0F1-type ATP synthase assembly protein I